MHGLEAVITSNTLSEKSFEIFSKAVIALIVSDLEEMKPEVVNLLMVFGD